jgi:hypothetical protein
MDPMRLVLTDGTVIDASMLNGTSRSSSRSRENAPSKRQVKQGGGGLKRFHSRTSGYVTSQGRLPAYGHATKATYADMETDPETGEVIRVLPKETAIVISSSRIKKSYTWDLGGSCSTGYIGGKGL